MSATNPSGIGRRVVSTLTRTVAAAVVGGAVGLVAAGGGQQPASAKVPDAETTCAQAVARADDLLTTYADAYTEAQAHRLTLADRQRIYRHISDDAYPYVRLRKACTGR